MDTQVTLKEAVELGAVDPEFYGRFFFPKACRQASPDFHADMDEILDAQGEEWRYAAFMVARGFAKTTKVRLYTSRRIAYRISRTIVLVGKSEDAAAKSLEWLKKAVLFNRPWADSFGITPGSIWTATDVEIDCTSYNERGEPVEKITVRVLARGMTGSLRGINIDDFRPDLIIVDDPCDDENVATPEQRKKTDDLFFGALQKSLAPMVDTPFAKMVLLQTVINGEDLISNCVKDPQWKTIKFSCFKEDEHGNLVSSWPERFPTKTLKSDKESHIEQNKLSLWLREMECKVVSAETAAFGEKWLCYYDTLPSGGKRCISVDPTPPPRDDKPSLNPKLDDAVIMALQMTGGKTYVLEYEVFKSPDPLEFILAIFSMARKWKIKLCGFETVLFQRVLASFFKKQMRDERFWLTVQSVEDKRNKKVRIQQDISGIAQQGDLYVRPEMYQLIQQFTEFPNVNHDDVLDALSIGVNVLSKYNVIEEEDDYIDGEFEVVDPEDRNSRLQWQRGAP